MSVASRLEEAQPREATVQCVAWLRRYLFTKELLWVSTFLLSGLYPPIVGCVLFFLYPFWRRYWRKHRDAGRKPQHLSEIQIQAAFECARIIKGQIEGYGGKARYQLTHRQGVKDVRRRDPGSEICQEIILPLVKLLGIPFPWDFTAGQGQPAPKEWHPESTVKY